MLRKLALLLPLALASCGPSFMNGEPDEAEPELLESSVQQGIVTCAERQDTGYTNGSSFVITVVTADGKPAERATANAYAVMQAAAAADGINLVVVSGFRTMSEQQYLYACYVNCNCNNCNLAAKPGYSNHQSGHAMDLNTSSPGVYTWLSNNAGRFGFKRTVPSEIWHWEWWGGGPGGGPCGAVTEDNCTTEEASNCGKFGCGCADHQCSGGFCPGTGCTAKHTQNCGAFGCGCIDGACNGIACPGSGCTAKETLDCSKFGCGCSDHKCAGGAACAGSACTLREATDCGKFGCNCADHQCSGGFCPKNGCTQKETSDCAATGCGCVDHKCSGGKCDGSGSTARNVQDCGAFGCGSIDATCNGGACPGTGCTVKQTSDCAKVGCGCADQKCSGGACMGSGCTANQTSSCAKADAGCSLGKCVYPGHDAGFVIDGGTPQPAPDDGGTVDPITMNDGGEVLGEAPPDGLDASTPFVSKPIPVGNALSPVTGGCQSATPLLPWAVAALALLRRRRALR